MEEKRKVKPWLVSLVVGLALLVAYPLSVPPTEYLVRKGYLPKWVCLPVGPVNFMARQCFDWLRRHNVIYWIEWRLYGE